MRRDNQKAIVVKNNQFYNKFICDIDELSNVSNNSISINIDALKETIYEFHIKLNYAEGNESSTILAYLLRSQLNNIKKVRLIVKYKYKRLNKILTLRNFLADKYKNIALATKIFMQLKTREEIKASENENFCHFRIMLYHTLLTILNSELRFLREKMNSYIQQVPNSIRLAKSFRPHIIVRPSLEEHKEEYLSVCIEYTRCNNVINNKKKKSITKSNNSSLENRDLFDLLLSDANYTTSLQDNILITYLYKKLKAKKKYIRTRYKALLRIHNNRNKLTKSIPINKANIPEQIKKEGLYNVFKEYINTIFNTIGYDFDDTWYIALINDEYCLSQLKAYEIELCFINSNMKKMRKHFRKRRNMLSEQSDTIPTQNDYSRVKPTTEKGICIEPGTSFIMPEEFLYKGLIMTDNKKRYSTSISLQENKNNRKDV